MGYNVRGKRTGTGPYKRSWQRTQGKKGKRLLMGEECPYTTEENKNLSKKIVDKILGE